MLPAIVNLDGFYLSFTRERVVLPEQRAVDGFLPPYEPLSPLRGKEPVSRGSAVMEGWLYSYFRYNTHAASLRAKEVFAEASREYGQLFGRSYGPVEGFMLDDAEFVLVMSNSFTALGRQAVKRMRDRGVHAGLLKLRMVRPFPSEEIAALLRGRKVVGVFDQNLAPGSGGIFYPEVAGALYHARGRPKAILPIVGALGGKQVTSREMDRVFEEMVAIDRDGRVPTPMFLMREDELARARSAVSVAEGAR